MKTDAVRWIERHCVYSDGERIGERAVLLDWQRDFVRELLSEDSKGRKYSRCYLSVAKKNGKTQLAS